MRAPFVIVPEAALSLSLVAAADGAVEAVGVGSSAVGSTLVEATASEAGGGGGTCTATSTAVDDCRRGSGSRHIIHCSGSDMMPIAMIHASS